MNAEVLNVAIPMTRRKLAEAKFFLGHLEHFVVGPSNRTMRENWEMFGFYLSAFLCAARSVPWVFQAENKEAYERVKPVWEGNLTHEDRHMLKFFNERRLDEVKRTGADVQRDTDFVPVTDVWSYRPGETPVAAILPIIQGVPLAKALVPAPKFDFGDRHVDVIVTCLKYVELLESLILAYEHSGA